MNQYQAFIFKNYSFDEPSRTIELTYSLDDSVNFTEKIVIPDGIPFRITEPAALDRALFALHLIGGISYYKTCIPKEIQIRSGDLTSEQAAFWNSVYENGLGEFFYKNQIDFRGLINFPANAGSAPTVSTSDNRKTRVLTPIGGGKDSLVTIELIRKGCFPQMLLRVGGHPFITHMAGATGEPLLTVERKLPAELFEMNAQGALNGHVPITAYISFLSVVLAELFGYSHVAFSNEGSANEGNVEMFGKQINHQWSKSLEFETAIQHYLKTFVTNNVTYFSLLRPLSELQVVRLFTKYPKYFPVFTSCNANWRILKERPDDRWCNDCPKCAFAFVMLSAFVDKDSLIEIFKADLFEDEGLLPLYRELLGLVGSKPFECVGTPQETAAAFLLARQKGGWDESVVMKMFVREYLPTIKDQKALISAALTSASDDTVPSLFQPLIANA